MKVRNDKIKILFVVPGQAEGVGMIFVKRQIASLEGLVEFETYYIQNRLNPFKLFFDYLALLKLVRKIQPLVIHAQYGTITSFVAMFLPAKAFVISIRGSDLDPNYKSGDRLRKTMAVLMTHISSLRAKKILAVSEHLANKIIFKSKVEILSSGIESKFFTNSNIVNVRMSLGWEIEKKYVFFNAGKEPIRKRKDLAIQFFLDLKKKIENLEFVLVEGDTPPERLLKMLRASDILFMTSDKEGSPNIVKEALALGVPVVGFDVGDVRELLSLDKNSICVMNRDSEEFLKSAEKILKAGKRGEADMRGYSTAAIAERLVKIYSELI